MQDTLLKSQAKPLHNRITIQPSPHYADRMAAAVLNPPLLEILDFNFWIGTRYASQVAFAWPAAWWWALTTKYPQPVSNQDMAHMLTQTAIARSVTATLDDADRRDFAAHLSTAPGFTYWKADCSAFEGLELLPGCYAAPTVILIEVAPTGSTSIKAIQINDLVMTPEDGEAWELTKYFAMQGISQHMVSCHHIPVHFPNDAINASMKRFLPKDHPLRILFTPHFRFSLPLSNSALHSKASILYNFQVFPYTPWTFPAKDVIYLSSTGIGGIEGNSGYPRYSFSTHAHEEVVGSYGQFLRRYHGVIRKWVGRVVETVDLADPQLRGWLDETAQWVTGFPDSNRISGQEQLADVLAYVLLNVSVMHAAEHHVFNKVPLAIFPERLRIPPPTSKNIPPFDRNALTTKLDAFRHWMGWKMFYEEVTATPLAKVKYGFTDSGLQEGAALFMKELRELDGISSVREIMALDDISASIQF